MPAAGTPRRVVLIIALGMMSGFGPLSMDFYLAGMPALAAELGANDALAQATMTTCMVGLALGQLVMGPWSDRSGRRIPLLVGVGVFAIASVGCAVAPTIETLLILRFLQGFAGSAGMVISRAVVRDLSQGADAARAFSQLMLVISITPIIAPAAGGLLLVVMDWRGLFFTLGGIGVGLFLIAALLIPDTLRPENRHGGGLAELLRQFGVVVRNRRFVFYALALGANAGVLFTYLAMSPLVFQGQLGVSEQVFGVLVSLNAIGMLVISQVNGALVGRIGARRMLFASLAIAVAAATGLAIGGVVGIGVIGAAIWIVIATSMHGASMPNINALALAPFAAGAGIASAMLGAMQFLMGGLIPPLVSIGGVSVTLMGATMAVCAAVALVFVVFAGPARTEPR